MRYNEPARCLVPAKSLWRLLYLLRVLIQFQPFVKAQNLSPVRYDSAGAPGCRCLSPDTMDTEDYDVTEYGMEFFGIMVDSNNSSSTGNSINNATDHIIVSSPNPRTYGFHECATHDRNTPDCSEPCPDESMIMDPRQLVCDKSYCSRSWCYVDPLACNLLHARSTVFENLHFSYATCGHADSFSGSYRLQGLNGQTLKVAVMRNSGGWKGSYSSSGEHYDGPWSQWSGVAVDFMREAAQQAGFRMEMTRPPEWLRNQTAESLGNANDYNHCIHSVALGYLDVCIFQATINIPRALAANYIQLDTEPVYLVTQHDSNADWDFVRSVSTVFAPLAPQTWFFICFFVIPMFGFLAVFHEYGNPNIFPKQQAVEVVDPQTKQKETKNKKFPLWQHLIRSVTFTLLSVMKGEYDLSTVSHGGFFNTLGISFFIVVLLAVYTANLASYFTIQSTQARVQSLDDALAQNWRFCMQRNLIGQTRSIFPYFSVDSVVREPTDIGGDGQPGYACPNCRGRTRSFLQVDPVRADAGDPDYCHAAIGFLSDLEAIQSQGLGCGLSPVAQVSLSSTGIPVSSKVSTELVSLALKLQIEGRYTQLTEASRPHSRCPATNADGGVPNELRAITLQDLSGLWIVAFGFAVVGIIITILQKLRRGSSSADSSSGFYLVKQYKYGVTDDDDDDDVVESVRSLLRKSTVLYNMKLNEHYDLSVNQDDTDAPSPARKNEEYALALEFNAKEESSRR